MFQVRGLKKPMFDVDNVAVRHAGTERPETTVKRVCICSIGVEATLAYDAETDVANKLGTRVGACPQRFTISANKGK